jgi:hypothetical protein
LNATHERENKMKKYSNPRYQISEPDIFPTFIEKSSISYRAKRAAYYETFLMNKLRAHWKYRLKK